MHFPHTGGEGMGRVNDSISRGTEQRCLGAASKERWDPRYDSIRLEIVHM